VTQLHGEEAGEGPPVVLVHAAVGDSRMWDPQWESFPRAHRTVRFDLPGFGRSPLPGPRFTPGHALLGVLDHLGLERAALVGASFGGRVALEVALARPERVSALVLAGAPLEDGHDWSPAARAFFAAEEAALARGDLDAAVEANLRTWLSPDADPEVRARVGEMQRRAFELQAAHPELEEEALVPDLELRLGDVRAPTLVLVGERDLSDFHAFAERLAAAIPGARHLVLPEAAHLPSLERPGEFDAVVLGFLAHASAA